MSNPTDPLETAAVLDVVDRHALLMSGSGGEIVSMARSHIATLASELARVRVELDAWKDQSERAISAANHMDAERHSAQELRDDATRQLFSAVNSIRSLIATIDRDNGERQEGETVAQSCERAGRVVAEMSDTKDKR